MRRTPFESKRTRLSRPPHLLLVPQIAFARRKECVMRFSMGSAALLFAGFVLVAVVVGCGFHRKSGRQKASGAQAAGVNVVAANASHLLHGRRLAVSVGSRDSAGYDITDIWVLEHRRLVNMSNRVREDAGADRADPFSLSPNGKYIAFFLQTAIRGACGDCYPVLYIMRSDGCHKSAAWAPTLARRFGRRAGTPAANLLSLLHRRLESIPIRELSSMSPADTTTKTPASSGSRFPPAKKRS